MKISKTHQHLSNYLKNPEVLTNPEPFLGPNWETVLRWWLYWESLTDVQRKELCRLYWAIDRDTRDRARDLARDVAIEVIGRNYWMEVFMVSPTPEALTCELIAMHLLFERGYSLTIVPIVNNL
jgi:hypothetical protein